MVDQHLQTGAGVTIAGLRVPRKEATEFGVIDADAEGKVRGFLEKPADPPGLPDSPEESFASMGNYVFTTDALLEALRTDAADDDSVHDMGGSIMPMLADRGRGVGLRLLDQRRPGQHRARPRLLARRRDDRRLLRRAHGPRVGHAGVQPLQRPLADLHAAAAAAAGEVRARRPRRGVDGQRRRDHRRRLGAQLASSHPVCGSSAARGSRTAS